MVRPILLRLQFQARLPALLFLMRVLAAVAALDFDLDNRFLQRRFDGDYFFVAELLGERLLDAFAGSLSGC